MEKILMIAVITSFGLVFASPVNAVESSAAGTNSGTKVFAEAKCEPGYEWNNQKKKCMKAERDY